MPEFCHTSRTQGLLRRLKQSIKIMKMKFKTKKKMKIKTINNKIKQSKNKYDLKRKTAKISALSSGNISKY